MAKNKPRSSLLPDTQEMSPLLKALVEEHTLGKAAQQAKAPVTRTVMFADPLVEDIIRAEDLSKEEKDKGITPLAKSILNVLNGPKASIERLAFEVDPSTTNMYAGVFKAKLRLIPDQVLKRIAIQDDLVASIVNARSNHLASFGRPRPDRFSTGFVIEADKAVLAKMDDKEKNELDKRIKAATRRLYSCGSTEGYPTDDRMSLAQYLFMSTRNAVVVGRVATEIIYAIDQDGIKKFHSFRPIDAGTIYKAAPQGEAQEQVRKQALHLLESIKNKKLEPEKFANDEYSWVQVHEGRPLQAFTPEECVVHNFYPVTDIELDGYPVTPLDTVIAAVTTHINITTHNKLYFQSGRAARGMLVFQSDDVDEDTVSAIRQQFNASINNVSNSWRMPVFGVGTEDSVTWQPIDSGSRDMEFQFLSDTNARVILSAFQMSPEELPGYSHLSRGTNAQALSECISLDSLVYTPAGYQTVGSILGDEKEVFTPIWDGSAWVNGRVFLSGKKQLRRTSVECGLSIDTSPDHRFLVVMDDGTLGWRDQDSLAEGDWVAINAIPVEGMGPVPTFKGREIDEDFMELMGWMTRDGTLVAPRYRSGGLLHLFYHPSKEQDIWERHSQMLSGWGLEHKHINKPLSLEEQSKRKQSCGAKSVEDRQVRNTVHNTDLVRWLIDQGFTTSAEGKSIPSMVFTLPVRLRQAFLRGFFSADGGKVNNTGSVAITIQADRLRSQTRQLLLSLGIRTLPCEGLLRAGFGREKTFSYKLFIKDRRQFWEQIGFIQPHKQLDKSPQKWSIGDLPAIMRDRFLRQCKDSKGFKKLTKSRRDTITACLKPGSKTNCSKEFLIRAMETCGLVIPTELTDKHYERVSQLEDLDLTVEMADVEMYSETHTFACQGFLVHNSNQEYKLQAHRDVGIRPLIAQWQDFINQAIFPLIDPQLAKFCSVKLVGLEAETAEKESIRLQQDMPVHMTFNDVLEQVEKDPVPVNVGGTFPLNPQWQAIVDKYVPVGVLLEQFFGIEGASQNPEWNYVRDPYFFQNREFNLQMQMMEQQAQAEQRAQAAGGPPPEEGEEEEGGGGEAAPQADPQAEQDLTRGLDQAIAILGKSENQLPPSKRRLLAQHRATVNNFMKEWEQDSQKFLREVMSLAEKHAPVHDKSEE